MKTQGNILLTHDGLEITNIEAPRRDKAMLAFFRMKDIAEREGDIFHILKETISQKFSYGAFYPGPESMGWDEFHGIFQEIRFNTYQYLTSFPQNTKPKTIGNLQEFQEKKHRTFGGFDIINKPGEDYIYDTASRDLWHEQWYAAHPQEIIWTKENDWLPRQDKAIAILKRELRKHDIGIPSKEEEVAVVFHDKVMRHKGTEIKAYAELIGTEICLSNYYKEEKELSDMENKAAGSPRKIFCIVNHEGKTQFISIDFAHGMFEFCDATGFHKGEYKFDGTYNADPEPKTHSLRCLGQWRQSPHH